MWIVHFRRTEIRTFLSPREAGKRFPDGLTPCCPVLSVRISHLHENSTNSPIRSISPRRGQSIGVGPHTRFHSGAMEGAAMSKQGINVLALIKGEERYVFLYDDCSTDQILQTLGQYAADPELSFSWYDAAVLSQRVRKLNAEVEDVSPSEADAVPRNRIRRSAA
jgi:hypothetical protein